MKTLKSIKKYFYDLTISKPKDGYDNTEALKPLPQSVGINRKGEARPITEYETRREEMHNSSEPIEGIFYIINDQIIPDFYSECLLCESKDEANIDRKQAMYHQFFFSNYIRVKYSDFICDYTSIPRGRISGISSSCQVFLDKCYEGNENIINQILELYHLPKNTKILTGMNYSCSNCKSFFDN